MVDEEIPAKLIIPLQPSCRFLNAYLSAIPNLFASWTGLMLDNVLQTGLEVKCRAQRVAIGDAWEM